ncbi:hypothetical protein HY031_00180, partial [Candidatus Gottesmanbacteria bacterium]|nr:hypothetical protein [Candidatus Gottesmanbacteria bacterium]
MDEIISATNLISLLLQVQQDALELIAASSQSAEDLRILILGAKSDLAKLTKQIRMVPPGERQQVGVVVTQVKRSIEGALNQKAEVQSPTGTAEWFDVT